MLIFTGRNDEMKAEVKVENLEFSDFSTTYHLFRLENLRGFYHVALLLVLVCRHRPHEFSSEHGMKLTSDTDMGISFFREQHTLKYADVHEKFNFLKIQDLRPLHTCQIQFEMISLISSR